MITCIAWKWYGEPKSRTKVSASTDYRDPDCPMPHLDPEGIRRMLEPFLADLEQADACITYNGGRFDFPILNGSMFLVGLPPIESILNYDLHQFGKIKGLKRGLDNIATHLGAAEHKLSLNHSQWQEGYLEPGWHTIKQRAKSDVVLTEQVYDLRKKIGWPAKPRMWKP